MVVVGIVFMVDALQTPKGERGLAASWAMDGQSMVQNGLVFISGRIGDHLYLYRNALKSQAELSVLKRKLSAINDMKIEMEQLREENRTLRRWSHFPDSLERFRPLGANVIGRNVSSLGRTLRIDQGKNAGLKKGDGVIDVDHQVVGRILWVSATAADIILVTDSASTVDIMIKRSRAHGMARGAGHRSASHLMVEDFDRLMDVQKDDVVLTAGTNEDFPKGLPLAVVTEIFPPNEGVYLKAEMTTKATLSHVEHVWVLRRNKTMTYPRLGQALVETIDWTPPPEQAEVAQGDSKPIKSLAADTSEGKLDPKLAATHDPVVTVKNVKKNEKTVIEIIAVKKTMKVVAPSGVKIRSGPGIEHWVVETKYKGEQLYATGEVKGKDWIRISLPTGVQGYVFAPLLSEIAQASINETVERR
jgi:rod shape-determining protein MreC